MDHVPLALAITSAITGLWAAYGWFRASRVDYRPFDGTGRELPAHDIQAWLGAVRTTVGESGRLNKRAAFWTAASVACTGLSALADKAMSIPG